MLRMERLPRGEWGPWLEANVEFTERTAQRYIRWRRRANLGGFLEAALTAHVDTLFPGPEAQGFDFPRRPRQ